jgi:hypothetical protein
MHQPARDLQPPTHAARQRLGRGVTPLREVHQLEQLVDALLALLRRHVVELGIDAEVLFERQVGIAGQRLRNYANPAPHLVRLFRHVVARNVRRARRNRDQRRHHADERGFSGAVRTEQSENLTFPHLERHAVHSRKIAVLLDDVAHFDCGRSLCGRGRLARGRFRIVDRLNQCSISLVQFGSSAATSPRPSAPASSSGPALRRSSRARMFPADCRSAASSRPSGYPVSAG